MSLVYIFHLDYSNSLFRFYKGMPSTAPPSLLAVTAGSCILLFHKNIMIFSNKTHKKDNIQSAPHTLWIKKGHIFQCRRSYVMVSAQCLPLPVVYTHPLPVLGGTSVRRLLILFCKDLRTNVRALRGVLSDADNFAQGLICATLPTTTF